MLHCGNVSRKIQRCFGYTGQAWLAEAGLWHYKARMYAPALGRFMQTDPIGYAEGLNWYDYVGGDPVNFTDPLGLDEQIVVQGVSCRKNPAQPACGGGGFVVAQDNRGTARVSSGRQGTRTKGGQSAATPGEETPETEDDNAEDIAICNSLDDAGARSRCFESANARDYARRWNKPLPPLITWRNAGPAGPTPPLRPLNPWMIGGVIGGVIGGGAAALCVILEPCGAAVLSILGLTSAGVLVAQ